MYDFMGGLGLPFGLNHLKAAGNVLKISGMYIFPAL